VTGAVPHKLAALPPVMVDMLSQARSIDPPIKQEEPDASVVRTILPITLARLIASFV
jgi:hypothetical protein